MALSYEQRHNLINLPISQRCEEIERIAEEWSIKDLHCFFPVLIENIFGATNGIGWGLRTTYRSSNPYDFEVLCRLLGPRGGIFRLCYRLINECSVKYEFHVFHLPPYARMMVEGPFVPQFYIKRLPQVQEFFSMPPTALLLNAFEFYMYHFACHLVHVCFNNLDVFEEESVYAFLTEEYLAYFLPVESSFVDDFVRVCEPVITQTTYYRNVEQSSLFRQSFLKQVMAPPAIFPGMTEETVAKIWRSEVLLHAFVDLWLSVEKSSSSDQKGFLPKSDHVKMIRVLVKHFHYFCNNHIGDNSPMDQLRSALPPTIRGKIYKFLRYTINYWPLDGSFQVVLETWLSFIQPWRYCLDNSRISIEESRIVHRKWQQFISQNFLAYTVIFQDLILRFERLDLTTLKNAHMLSRVMRVYSQSQLNSMLAEIELSLNFDSTTDISTLSNSITQATSIAASQGPKWCSSVRKQIEELEGSKFHYKAMFDNETGRHIMNMVIAALREAKRSPEILPPQSSVDWFQKLKQWFILDQVNNNRLEKEKVVLILENAIIHVCRIFQMEMPDISQPTSSMGSDISGEFSFQCSSSFLNTTPPLHKMRGIQFRGDPDLKSIQSNENAFLVKVFHRICSRINNVYHDDILLLYHRSDFYGYVARELLSPPVKVHKYRRNPAKCYSELVEQDLPPRLSLRRFASHSFLIKLMILFLFCWFLGTSPVLYCFVCFILYIGWVLLKAASKMGWDHFHRT